MAQASATRKLFMLDNLDSFTYNLVDEFQCLGYDPIIYRNTLSADFIIAEMEKCSEEVILVLSPGPGNPTNAGCLMELIDKSVGKFPIIGICLGHQALIQHYGGTIDRAPEIVHGKSSDIIHQQTGAFAGINSPLPVARYHSLVATQMPDEVKVTAYCQTTDNQQLPMAIEHSTDAIIGFQFHPESILTTYGSNLLAQSIDYLLTLNAERNSQTGNEE